MVYGIYKRMQLLFNRFRIRVVKILCCYPFYPIVFRRIEKYLCVADLLYADSKVREFFTPLGYLIEPRSRRRDTSHRLPDIKMRIKINDTDTFIVRIT